MVFSPKRVTVAPLRSSRVKPSFWEAIYRFYVTVEPCVMCGGALAWSQIGRVVYGAADPKRGYSTYSERIMHPRTEVCSGVLREECEAVMHQFFATLRK